MRLTRRTVPRPAGVLLLALIVFLTADAGLLWLAYTDPAFSQTNADIAHAAVTVGRLIGWARSSLG